MKSHAQDTLYFKLSNPWNTVKDPIGQYTRKCVKEKDYFHVWDYNRKNMLVTESFYTDTNFTRKLLCHKYYNQNFGYLEQSRCYENGRLNGYWVMYDAKGDTTSYDVMENNNSVRSWSREPQDANVMFEKVETEAEFPGGHKAWVQFLKDNLSYPDSLQHINGQVILEYIISKEGEISDIKVIKSLHPVLDKEAIRVLQKSPKWKPATQNGKIVRAYRKQPFTFGSR